MSTGPHIYPHRVSCAGTSIEIMPMTPADALAVGNLVASLPAHDLLFLSRDVTHPKVLAAWMEALGTGRVTSLVARARGNEVGELVGCTAIVTQELSWSRHVGELRVLVAPAWRGQGLGQVLVQECLQQALALGLEKLCVQMTIDQRAAIAAFEGVGFRAEALLRGHVKDREGQRHDLAVLSHDVARVGAAMQAFGLQDALGA